MDNLIDDIIEAAKNGELDLNDTDALAAFIDNSGADDDLKNDILDAVSDNPEPKAQEMADEDGSEVTVMEEDADGDGDADKTVITKSEPEDDSTFTDEELSLLTKYKPEEDESSSDESEDSSDEGNSDESEDKPHDTVVSDERMKNIIGTLSSYKY